MNLKTVVVAILLAACFVAACKDKDDPLLAVVNGREIRQSEFDAYLQFKRIAPTDEKRRDEALEGYLKREALAAVIEEQKLLDAERVEVEVREFKKEMLISRYFDEFLKENATDSAIKNYYDNHAQDYEEKKVHVAHILMRTNRGMSEAERQAKLTAARDVHAKLAAGATFEELAAEYSEDKVSGRKGGDLGWLKDGSIDPKFSKNIFSMSKGQVSEPFETSFGFHIVKVLDSPQVVKRPYRSVAGDIRYQLRGKAKDAETERLEKLVKIERKEPYQAAKAPPVDPSARPSEPQKPPTRGDNPGGPPSLVSAPGRQHPARRLQPGMPQGTRPADPPRPGAAGGEPQPPAPAASKPAATPTKKPAAAKRPAPAARAAAPAQAEPAAPPSPQAEPAAPPSPQAEPAAPVAPKAVPAPGAAPNQ